MGIHGFTRDEEKAAHAHVRIKAINPELSENDLTKMKMELVNLLKGPTFATSVLPPTIAISSSDDHGRVRAPNTQPAIYQHGTDNQSKRFFPFTNERNLSGSHDNGRTMGDKSAQEEIDNISEITEHSTQDDERRSTNEQVRKMEPIPERTETRLESGRRIAVGMSTTPRVPKAGTCRYPISPHNASLNLPVKQCFECGHVKTQDGFTASQWKKKVGIGKCVNCVSQSVQWKSCNITIENLQLKTYATCQQQKRHDKFSPNQWKRPAGTGRCRDCIKM